LTCQICSLYTSELEHRASDNLARFATIQATWAVESGNAGLKVFVIFWAKNIFELRHTSIPGIPEYRDPAYFFSTNMNQEEYTVCYVHTGHISYLLQALNFNFLNPWEHFLIFQKFFSFRKTLKHSFFT
jgi:hypothetical protein